MQSTYVSGNGPACMLFEEELKNFLGIKHVFFTNSCTAALDLAYRVKKFPPGSEVIVPNFTYTSTALAPILNNLNVVLADVYPDNGNIDPDSVEKLITNKTVAISPVDYAGNPADLDPLKDLAERYGLYLVHDTAQSLGAEYKDRKTGTDADVCTFSFHGTKNITTGEGGALCTDDDEIAERIAIMREKGTNKQSFIINNKTRGFYEFVEIGNSYVQSNILGALGLSQLRKVESLNEEREKIASYYISELEDIPNLDFIRITSGAKTNWHIFGILVPDADKDWIMDALRAEGIMANIHYTPLHKNRLYKSLSNDEEMKGAMKFYNSFLRLPMYPSLRMHEREKIVSAVRKVMTALL